MERQQQPPVDEDDPPTTAVEAVPEAMDLRRSAQSPPGAGTAGTPVRPQDEPAPPETPKVGSRDAPGG